MKKLILSAILLMGVSTAALADSCCPTDCDPCETSCAKCCEPKCVDECECAVNARSFFSMRPRFQASSPERISIFRRHRLHAREDGYDAAFQVAVYGGRTTKSERLASYFTPFCKNFFIVAEDDTDAEQEIRARHLNIVTRNENFKSRVCLAPEQSYVGVGLVFQHAFWEKDDGRSYWWRASLPITRVKNKMNLNEEILEDGGGLVQAGDITGNGQEALDAGAVANVVSAFKQSSWCFGRIDDCCDNTKTRPEELELTLGKEWVKEDICHFDSFFGFLVPTSSTPDGCEVFEPVSGHNGHWGILMGNNIGFQIWESESADRNLRVAFDTHWQYMFSKDEVRSFDVKNKPWSRYMQVYASKADAQAAATDTDLFAHTPGINVFTREVKVKPRYSRTYNTAFILTSGKFQGELGYNFFCRDSECVELDCDCPFPTEVAFRSVGPNSSGNGHTDRVQGIMDQYNTDSFANLTELPVANYDDNVISECDLDLDSAAHPCTTQHTFYGSLGCRWDEREYPIFAGLGASYEFSRDNAGINRWTVWGKGGVSF